MKERRLILDRYKEKPPRPEPEIPEAELPPILQTETTPEGFRIYGIDYSAAYSHPEGVITVRIPYRIHGHLISRSFMEQSLPRRTGYRREIDQDIRTMQWVVADIPDHGRFNNTVNFSTDPVASSPTASGGFVNTVTINSPIVMTNVEVRERMQQVLSRALRRQSDQPAIAFHSEAMAQTAQEMQSIATQRDAAVPPVVEERRRRLRERIEQLGQEPAPPPPARVVRERSFPATKHEGPEIDFPREGWMRRLWNKVFDMPTSTHNRMEEVSVTMRAREAVEINRSVPREVPEFTVPAALQGFVYFRGRHQIAFRFNVEDLTASGHFLTVMRLMPLPPEGWQVVQTFTERCLVQFTYWRYEFGEDRED